MNLYEILGILFIHWFADFVLQTDKQAKGKNWNDLLEHTLSYSFVWLMLGTFYALTTNNIWNGAIFALITFVCHTITDYFTSRLNSHLWQKGQVHNFFVSVGFDQWLHYTQLFITYQLLN